MDYKEKYEQALERAQKELQTCGSTDCDAAKQIFRLFPELKEDEDELEWLKQFIQEEAYILSMDIRDDEDSFRLKKLQRSLEWLEKQGEKTINQPDFEIPFGAKDSELIEESYYIPKGYHAEISKDKVTIKKGEQKTNSQNAQDIIKKYVSDHAENWLDASELEQLLNDFVLEYDKIRNREYEQQCKCKGK